MGKDKGGQALDKKLKTEKFLGLAGKNSAKGKYLENAISKVRNKREAAHRPDTKVRHNMLGEPEHAGTVGQFCWTPDISQVWKCYLSIQRMDASDLELGNT